jgi:hypothetical protein
VGIGFNGYSLVLIGERAFGSKVLKEFTKKGLLIPGENG